jgi:hypothetical protein
VAERPATPGGRHRWIFEVLDRAGAVLQGSERGIHAYRLGDGLSTLLKREELRITFRRRLAGQAGVELATPGSWLHDQLIRYALRRGKVTLVHLRPREDLDRAALLTARRRGAIELSSLEEKRYGVLLIFTFNLAYYSVPPANETLTITYDAQRGKVVQRPVGRKSLFDASSEPEEGFGPPPAVDVALAFHRAWEAVQEHVETRVGEIQKAGQVSLDRELATVERYYRQLIEEEKSVLKGRGSRRAQDESRRKIELLKVDWERRVKEETERLKPQVVAVLSAVAQVRTPLERWRCRGHEEDLDREVWVDLARADTWETAGGRVER